MCVLTITSSSSIYLYIVFLICVEREYIFLILPISYQFGKLTLQEECISGNLAYSKNLIRHSRTYRHKLAQCLSAHVVPGTVSSCPLQSTQTHLVDFSPGSWGCMSELLPSGTWYRDTWQPGPRDVGLRGHTVGYWKEDILI